jgi:A/G-specific adenine glycosylase
LPWFDTAKRALPWRRSRDPYRLLVSEVMLQQTQVSRVIEYYRRFLRAFPTCRALAEAPLDEVLHAWAGLGYYARARNLQRACQVVTQEYGGRFPQRFEQAAALPGIGRYTAGAVLSIAFGQRHPAVDANVRRVLCRVLLERGDTPASRKRVERFAAQAVPEARAGDYNQALMELGALVCVSRSPRCPHCPLRGLCRANLAGKQHTVPASVRPAARRATVALALVQRRGRVLLAQRPAEGRWGGLWVFPSVELGGEGPEAALTRLLAEEFGLQVAVGEPVMTLTHTFTQRRITLTAYACAVQGGRTRAREHRAARWVKPEELGGYALPSPHRRVAEAWGAE